MTSRLMYFVLFAVACVQPSLVAAQAPFPGENYGYANQWAPGSVQYAGYPSVAPGAYPQGQPVPHPSMISPASAVQAGFAPRPTYGYSPTDGYSPGCAGGNCPGCDACGSEIITRRIGRRGGPVEPSPLESMLTTAVRNSWVRLEYLSWEFKEPANEILGAPILGVANPRAPFPVFDFANPPNQIGVATVPDLSEFKFRDNNGVRATWGTPLRFGTFEMSGFLMAQVSDRANEPFLPSPGTFVATSTLQNGQISNIVQLYNQGFAVAYESDLWGVSAKVVYDTAPPGEGIKLRPLCGFRFISLQERLRQDGIFDDPNDTVASLHTTIDSYASNRLFGTIIGFRAEAVHRWITVGIEAQASAAVNRFRARVGTQNFRSVDDGHVETTERHTVFSPIGELGGFVQWHIREDITFHVAFTGIWLPNVTRPERNIYYNDVGPNAPPAVVVRAEHDHMLVRGVSFGGEIEF